MPPFGPITRQKLIRSFRKAAFEGPYPGKKHQFMYRPEDPSQRVYIPNPHGSEISKNLLARILRQAGITRDEWESL
ncbi:MAG TPA: type II toxin-antitoxin system HicA family toxin [Rhodothermales bacterium]|nr:type II toxin-antitoxin system HicA family toxin [Rhodothermales bacterium]